MSLKSILHILASLPRGLYRLATKNRKTKMATILVFFGLIIAFNMFRTFMIGQFFAHYEPPPITISSVTVAEKPWAPTLQAVGNFQAIDGVDVNAQTSGNVIKLHFTSGEYVEKGEPLIDIDDAIEQTTLKFNLSELTLKTINFKRQEDLIKRGATSGSSLDEARAQLQQAQANVEKIQAEILQKHITAPFSGKTGIRNVNLGQYVTPGTTTIVTLQSLDPLYLTFNLPEQNFKQLHIGQRIEFHTDAFPDYFFQGKISAINSKVDVTTHNILVQGTLANCPQNFLTEADKKALVTIKTDEYHRKIVTCDTDINIKNHIQQFSFIPGMFAAIKIEQPVEDNVILVPSTAISYSLYGDAVYRLEPDKDGKKDSQNRTIYTVKRIFVKTGSQDSNNTVILSGLKKGDIIVSAGEIKLQNGAKVVINNDIQLKTYANPDALGQ